MILGGEKREGGIIDIKGMTVNISVRYYEYRPANKSVMVNKQGKYVLYQCCQSPEYAEQEAKRLNEYEDKSRQEMIGRGWEVIK